MKTKAFIMVCLFIGISIIEASAQKGTPFRAYPARVQDGYGSLMVSCDGVNVDFLEYTWDGTDIFKIREEGTTLKEICHWKFTSVATGEEFKTVELVNMNVIMDSQGAPLHAEGTSRANLRGNAGSHYILTIYIDYNFENQELEYKFIDIKCF